MKPIDPINNIEVHGVVCDSIKELYAKKNSDYGNSFAGLRHRYPNFVCMRIFDKLNRLDNIMKPGYECEVSDETIEDTLMDIANYAIMEITERRIDSILRCCDDCRPDDEANIGGSQPCFDPESESLLAQLEELVKSSGRSVVVLKVYNKEE